MLHELAMCATNDTGANVEHAVQGEIDMAFGTMICELTSITGKNSVLRRYASCLKISEMLFRRDQHR